MRLSGAQINRAKVVVEEIHDGIAECRNLASNMEVSAYMNTGMKLYAGQVVILEYRQTAGICGYIVLDELMQTIKMEVLKTFHMVCNGALTLSIILYNSVNKTRLHMTVKDGDKLFENASVLIEGDMVKLSINDDKVIDLDIIYDKGDEKCQ